MKKYFLISILLIASFTVFSQVKHNKFSTKIKFAQFNPTFQFGATVISELDNQGGYILSNHYDDQSGGFHPSLVMLDLHGNIVFDSIYEFIPNNFIGSTNIVKSVTSSTFNLMQNDVIYIEPNRAKVRSSAFNENNSVIISAVGTLATIIAIFITR